MARESPQQEDLERVALGERSLPQLRRDHAIGEIEGPLKPASLANGQIPAGPESSRDSLDSGPGTLNASKGDSLLERVLCSEIINGNMTPLML